MYGEKYTMCNSDLTMPLVTSELLRSQGLMLKPRQLRAARVLVGWSRAMLAKKSGVPGPTIEKFEIGQTDPKLTTAGKLRLALERAGVIFIDPDSEAGPGIRLKDGKVDR